MSITEEERYYLKMKALFYLYEKDYTQIKTAKMLGISRVTLNKLLHEAKNEGLIRHQIIDPSNIRDLFKLEDQLKSRYHLTDVKILSCTAIDQQRVEYIGSEAAKYIKPLIHSDMKIGIAWGRALYATLKYLPPDPLVSNIQVYTLLGAAYNEPQLQPNLMAQLLLNAYNGSMHVMNGPYLCYSELLCAEIKKDTSIAWTLNNVHSFDLCIVGIGAKPSNSSYFHFDDTIVNELTRLNAVGDICGNFITAKGEPCISSISSRILSIDIQNLKRCKNVVGIAYGADKVPAIIGALSGGYIKTLITDHATARELLL